MKKKILCCILALCMILPLAACVAEAPAPAAPAAPAPAAPAPEAPATPPADGEEPDEGQEDPAEQAPTEPFPGRIAIITNEVSQNEEEFRSAEALQQRYGEDKVIHRVWPAMFAQEGEMMISIMQELAADPELRAVIINQAVINTNAAVDALLAVRDDVFVVYASAAEDPADVAMRANLLLDVNNPAIGSVFVSQAAAMGAETIAHYSFPRHMGVPLLALRRDNMRAAAESYGINFVELVAPDPMGDGGVAATQLHITQDLPRQVDALGQNTVFFGTNCGMMPPMIAQVLATGAMFVQPCCPSPYHGYPGALGLEAFVPTGEYDEDGEPILALMPLPELLEATSAAIAAQDMTGRIAGWAIPAAMMWTTIGFYYAVEWINGNVPQEFGVIDISVLDRLAREYGASLGLTAGANLEPLVLDGRTFDHFILGTIDYIVY
jgi:hypothetical protein